MSEIDSTGFPNSSDSRKTIYIMFATHLDIGYTAPPDCLELQHKLQLDEVLDLCREYHDYCYTIECTWILRQWLKRTSDKKRIREMADRIREGRIEVCGAFASMHSSVAGPEDTNQLCYEARRLQEELGIEIVTAMLNDVPGYSWAYPQVLRKSGMKYLFAGLNDTAGGGLEVKPQSRPIYWEGIDGSRILLQTMHLYMLHHAKLLHWFWDRDGDMDETIRSMDSLFEGNPCDTTLLVAAPGDNKGALENFFIHQQIRKWNREERPYRVLAGTPRRYFEYVEERYGDQLEVWRGDWPATCAWDLVKVRAPIATAAYRHAQTHLPTAEKLLAIDAVTKKKEFPRYDVEQAYEELLKYGEHSAPEGHATPALSRREILWSNHVHFFNACRAMNLAEGLYQRARLRIGIPEEEERIVVFNPLGWERTDMVRVPIAKFHGSFDFGRRQVLNLIDMETNETVSVDHEDRSEWRAMDGAGDDAVPCVSFVARNVAGFGYRMYKVVKDEERDFSDTPIKPRRIEDTVIENEKYRVSVDPCTGNILSIRDKELDREIAGGRLEDGTPVPYNTIISNTPLPDASVRVSAIAGAHFEKLVIERLGSWHPRTEVRLARGMEQVEIRHFFDRQAWKRDHSNESVWDAKLRFPLCLSPEKTRVVVSGPNGFRRVPEDQLPGSGRDAWPSSAFISMDDGQTCIIISSPTDYLFRLGEARGDFYDLYSQCAWQYFGVVSRSGGNQILPFTEPKEEDLIVHSYAITSRHGGFCAEAAQKFGWGFRTEMIGFYTVKPDTEDLVGGCFPTPYGIPCRVAEPFSQFGNPAQSLIDMRDGKGNVICNVNVAAFRRSLFASQPGMILRLQEMVGHESQTVTIRFAAEMKLLRAAHADMTERKTDKIKVARNGFSFEMGPFEIVTFDLTFR